MEFSEKILKDVIYSLSDGVILVDCDQKIVLWNSWLERISGISASKVTGASICEVFPEIKGSRIDLAVKFALNDGQSAFISHTINKVMFPLYLRGSKGENEQIVQNITIYPVGQKPSRFAVVQIRDESTAVLKENMLRQKAREEQELNLRLQEEIIERSRIQDRLKLSAAVIQNTIEGVVITDKRSVVESINPAFTEITGYKKEDIVGKKIAKVKSGKHSPQYYKNMWNTLLSVGHWRGEFINKKPDGELFIVESSIVCIKDSEGKITNYVNIFHDITNRKKNESLLRKLSTTDSLTGLSNRRAFDLEYAKQWEFCMRHNLPLSIGLLDVDHFKAYNDNYGHLEGDTCLIKVAYVLSRIIHRKDDMSARYGGEEFVLLLPGTTPQSAYELVEEARQKVYELKIPHEHSSIVPFVTVSGGVAGFAPKVGQDSQDLILEADQALYRAKNSGRNCISGSHTLT